MTHLPHPGVYLSGELSLALGICDVSSRVIGAGAGLFLPTSTSARFIEAAKSNVANIAIAGMCDGKSNQAWIAKAEAPR